MQPGQRGKLPTQIEAFRESWNQWIARILPKPKNFSNLMHYRRWAAASPHYRLAVPKNVFDPYNLTSDEIVGLRPEVVRPRPGNEPLAVLHEKELATTCGELADVTTVLVRGSECSFRCAMCDLWKHTHVEHTATGSVPAQVRFALEGESHLGGEGQRWIKLYNASNFFAPKNVPTADLPEIASLLDAFDRVIVENHPTLLTPKMPEFASWISGRLEVAMGLETVHEQTLGKLNKRMTVDDFARACEWLLRSGIDIRAFLLLRPPGMSELEGVEWCVRSIEFARRCGVRHVSVIPTRAGNGTTEYLKQRGLFSPPKVKSLEDIQLRYAGDEHLLVTVDTWDWSSMSGQCQACSEFRRRRAESLNLRKLIDQNEPAPACDCEASG